MSLGDDLRLAPRATSGPPRRPSARPGPLLAVGNPVVLPPSPTAPPPGPPPADVAGLGLRSYRRRDRPGPLPGTRGGRHHRRFFPEPRPTLLLGPDANEREPEKLASDGALEAVQCDPSRHARDIDDRARSALPCSPAAGGRRCWAGGRGRADHGRADPPDLDARCRPGYAECLRDGDGEKEGG